MCDPTHLVPSTNRFTTTSSRDLYFDQDRSSVRSYDVDGRPNLAKFSPFSSPRVIRAGHTGTIWTKGRGSESHGLSETVRFSTKHLPQENTPFVEVTAHVRSNDGVTGKVETKSSDGFEVETSKKNIYADEFCLSERLHVNAEVTVRGTPVQKPGSY